MEKVRCDNDTARSAELPDQRCAEGKILHCAAGKSFLFDPAGMDALFYKPTLHSGGFRTGFILPLAA